MDKAAFAVRRSAFRQWNTWRRAGKDSYTLYGCRRLASVAREFQGDRVIFWTGLRPARSAWKGRTLVGGRHSPAEQKNQQGQDDDGDKADCYVHFQLHAFLYLLWAMPLYTGSRNFAR